MYEEAFFNLIGKLQKDYGLMDLTLGGAAPLIRSPAARCVG